MRVLALVVLAFVGLAVGLAPLHYAPDPATRIAGQYLVMFHQNTTADDLDAELAHITAVAGVTIDRTWRIVIRGFGAKMDAKQVAVVRANPKVALVEEDQIVTIAAEEQTCTVQPDATWGINRISQRTLNLDGEYQYPPSAGEGVVAYIFDTGIYVGHNDFLDEQGNARAAFGWKAETAWSNTDGNGHGTHVASTTAGTEYGVAKKADLVAVKVLSDAGSGSWQGVVSGIEWAIQNFQGHGRPSVGNMSLGGGRTEIVNAAVNQATSAGLHIVVAAGNNNFNACNYSPSSAAGVISVGATDVGAAPDGSQEDVRSYFSNFGTCVHVLAPGSDVTAAWIGSPSAIRAISGTSMASPHVCGVAALVAGENPNWSFTQLRSYIQQQATENSVNLLCSSALCLQTPNLLVYNGCRQ